MTRHAPKTLGNATLTVVGLLLLAGSVTGCGSAYTGQIAVPNTNQRLVVGHDNWPSKQIWVIEGGKVESVKVIKEDRK